MKMVHATALMCACAIAANGDVGIPQGRFGYPLGAYLTIEGVQVYYGKSSGAQTLLVDTVDGKKLDKPTSIWIANVQPPEGQRCVFRGYEHGKMIGVPHKVAEAEKLPVPQVGWQFSVSFIVTSVVEPKTLTKKKYSLPGEASTSYFVREQNTRQIEIQADFVAVDTATIDELKSKKPDSGIDLALLSALRAEGRATLLYSPRLLTCSGDEVTVKTVEEVRYPTEYFVDVLSNVVGKTAAVIGQGGFDTREVGVVLTAQAETDFNCAEIRLRVDASIVDPPKWQTFPVTYVDSSGVDRTTSLQQPSFGVRHVTTSITVKNGQTAIVGSGMTASGLKSTTFLLLTARVLDSEGRSITNAELEAGGYRR